MKPRSNVTEFVLLGLTQSIQGQKIFFVLFLLIYILMMVGNRLIILTVVVSPTLDTPMYFFRTYHLWMLLFYYSHPKCYYRLTLWDENHFLPRLHDPAFGRTLTWWCWDFAFGSYGLWPLCGHLQTLVLLDNHESVSAYSAADVGLGWWVSTCCSTTSLGLQPYLLWLQCHWPFDMWHLPFVKTCLCGYLHYWPDSDWQWEGDVSYGVIIHFLKTLSQEERCKALSSCGSHITMAVLFFVPCIFMHVRPPSILPINKSLTVFCTIITLCWIM